MTPEEFERQARNEGYGATKRVEFAALSRSETHTHDKISFVYVVEGEFILNTAKGAARHLPGETCVLAANVEHAEEAGANGATILVARK